MWKWIKKKNVHDSHNVNFYFLYSKINMIHYTENKKKLKKEMIRESIINVLKD